MVAARSAPGCQLFSIHSVPRRRRRSNSSKTGRDSLSTQQTYTAAHRLPLHRHHQIRERPQRRIHFRLREVLAPHHLEQRVLPVEAGRQRPEDVQ